MLRTKVFTVVNSPACMILTIIQSGDLTDVIDCMVDATIIGTIIVEDSIVTVGDTVRGQDAGMVVVVGIVHHAMVMAEVITTGVATPEGTALRGRKHANA